MALATGQAALRTDPEIFGAARSALDRRPDIPATVRVHVAQGVATLTGGVRLPSEQAAAEDVVRRIEGVRQIVNHILIARLVSKEGFEAPDDLR